MTHPGHATCATCGGSIFRENTQTTQWYHLDSGVTKEPPCRDAQPVNPKGEVTP